MLREIRSGYITQLELKQALVNGDWQPFDDQTVQMLMRIFDQDGSGTISFGEFQGLWNYIKEWQRYVETDGVAAFESSAMRFRANFTLVRVHVTSVFRQFDRDRSGTIEPQELANALSTFGYNLSPQLIQLLQRKYSSFALSLLTLLTFERWLTYTSSLYHKTWYRPFYGSSQT